MPPEIRICAAALAFLCAGVAFAQEVRLSAEQEKALGIATMELRAGGAGRIEGLSAQVIVPAQQLHVVSAPLPGLLERALVASDEPVRKGQVLARMQSPAVADLQHTYLQAAAQAQLARSDLERDEQLFADGIVAEKRLLATRARFQEVSADLAERTQALKLAGMSASDIGALRAGRSVGTAIELRSPVDGVVLEQIAAPGERLEAASPAFKVAQLDPLWLEVQVPLGKLASVAVGAEVAVPALDAIGKVIAVGRSIGQNQTVMVRAEVRGAGLRLRPGQFVEVTISARQADGQWLIPNSALARTGDKAMVFVRAGDRFTARSVQVVREGAEGSIVQGELKAGERIAVKGVSSLKAAMLGIGS